MALDIKREMVAFDKKDRTFFEKLTPEEKKEFSTFMMIRWGASVAGDSEVQEYYLRSCNVKLNNALTKSVSDNPKNAVNTNDFCFFDKKKIKRRTSKTNFRS